MNMGEVRVKAGLLVASEGSLSLCLDFNYLPNPPSSSGISVENPGRPSLPGGSLVQDLLRRAAEQVIR